ncbi:MAG: ABC transporter permease, partial [Rikenellaceae bacterium]
MIRNFITTLRQFALSSILNIIGLSVTISAFILIMMQVNYEYSVGTSDPRHKNIYRLESKNQGESMWGITIHPRIYENFLKCTPQVEEHAEFLYSSTTIKVEELVYKNIPQTLIISDISKLFHVEMKEGVFSSVMDPGNVVVSESLAKKLFGTVSAIGKKIDDKVVSGVCKDFGPASIITDGMFVKSYSGSYASSFCYLSDNIDTKAIVENFKALAKRDLDGFGITDMKLVAIKDNYFDNNFVKNSFVKRGNITITNILLSVAILIIIIAIINFINFSTALAPVRIKDLNTRSVLGSSRQALRWRIIAEALCFTLVSYVIALAIVDIVVKTSLLGLFKADDMSILTNIGVVLAVFVLSIVIGCIAGLYPAFYSTSFEPSLVLNGSYKLSAGGNYLSFGLIGFQFLVSMALIIIAFFVGLQNKYIEDKDLGYRDENVVLVSSIYDQAKLSVIESRIKKLAGVKGTARYNGSFGV